MKQKAYLLEVFFIVVFLLGYAQLSTAQSSVDANEIERALKSGKDVTYENVKIMGVLDLTSMKEELPSLPKRNKFSNGDNTIETTIEGDITFINCVFEDDFYAYFHDQGLDYTDGNSYYTFVAHFDGKVTIKNCDFKERAWFKYSDFDDDSDFSGSKFGGSTTFKYAKFEKDASFESSIFEDESTFKYSEFSEHVSFANSIFHEDAIFKYTKFKEGTSFENTVFKDDLDFKYTKIRGPFEDGNMVVRGKMNTKYTKVNGKEYSGI